jgi:hypothetical protein
MWGPLYVQEKMMQYRLEELDREGRRPRLQAEGTRLWRRLADRAGRTLVRWGTRLQAAGYAPEFAPGESPHLAGAEK